MTTTAAANHNGTAARALAAAPTPAGNLPALLAEWELFMHAAGLSERTIHDRCDSIARWGRTTTITAPSAGDIALILANPHIKAASTRASYYRTLRAWTHWLLETERLTVDPMRKLRPPRTPVAEPRPVTLEQLQRLLATRMKRKTRTMILLAVCQGLRVHEIAKVRSEDIDLRTGTITVDGKGGKRRTLPLHPLVAEAADWMPTSGWWFPAWRDNRQGDGHVLSRSVSTLISGAMTRAGIAATAHQLRHTFATELLRSGADMRTVQELMRHSSLQSTQIYTRVADAAKTDAIQRLTFLPRR